MFELCEICGKSINQKTGKCGCLPVPVISSSKLCAYVGCNNLGTVGGIKFYCSKHYFNREEQSSKVADLDFAEREIQKIRQKLGMKSQIQSR